MSKKAVFDIRVILESDDELYPLFAEAKSTLGVKSNTEAARILLKKGCEWLKGSTFAAKQP